MDKHVMNRLAVTGGALAAMLGLAIDPLHAAIHVESGDAGDLPGSSQLVGAGTDTIQGDLTTNADVDLFQIVFNTAGVYAFETRSLDSAGGTLDDPDLFLFNSAGNPLAASDDNDAGIPGGDALDSGISIALSPGTYYLAIGVDNINALDAANNIIAYNDIGVQDPNGVLAGWQIIERNAFGTYTILLSTPTGIPEPASLSLLALAGIALLRRR